MTVFKWQTHCPVDRFLRSFNAISKTNADKHFRPVGEPAEVAPALFGMLSKLEHCRQQDLEAVAIEPAVSCAVPHRRKGRFDGIADVDMHPVSGQERIGQQQLSRSLFDSAGVSEKTYGAGEEIEVIVFIVFD